MDQDTPETHQPNGPKEREGAVSMREASIITVILMVAAVLRLGGPDLAYFSCHAARDVYRSQELIWGGSIPLLGSELQYGGRSLGPALYFIAAPALLLWKSPIAISLWIGILDVAACFVIWRVVRRLLGSSIGLWTAAFYAFFPLNIVQLRFLWNPSYLPFFLALGLWGLVAAVLDRRPGGLFAAVVGYATAFQIHFSVIHGIVCASIILLAVRPKIESKYWWRCVGLAVLFFSPSLVAEVGQSELNVGRILKPDWYTRAGSHVRFNPNASEVFLHHVYPIVDEDPGATGFTCLESFTKGGVNWFRPSTFLLLQWIAEIARVQFVLWLLGVGICLVGCLRPGRARSWIGLGEGGASVGVLQRLPYVMILLWQVVPIISLSFFDLHVNPDHMEADAAAIIPFRYFVVTHPMPFVCAALGIVALSRWTTLLATRIVRGARGGDRVFPAGRLFELAAVGLLASYVVLDVKILQSWSRSGGSVAYGYPNVIPSLRTMIEARDILLGRVHIDAVTYYERVHSQQFGQHQLGEAGLDWLITQDARAWTNPRPDERRRWLLHMPFALRKSVVSLRPALPPDAREVRRWPLGPVGSMTLIEYFVEDPDEPLPISPAQVEMRNIYHKYDIMRYLGPSRAASIQASGPLPRYPLPPFPISGRIDVGDIANSVYLVFGWFPPTEEMDRSVRWMWRKGLVRTSIPPAESRVLRISAWAAPLNGESLRGDGRRLIEIRINDRLIGTEKMVPEQWQDILVPLPDDLENFELQLFSAEMGPDPAEQRCLAVESIVLEYDD